MTSTTLTQYTDKVTTDSFATCGELVWYSVTEAARIKHDALEARLTSVGLESFTPGAPRDDDTFLRVTSAAQRKREPMPGDESKFQNFLVRKVAHSKETIIKQIVVETVDAGNKRLDFKPVIQLEFIKGDIVKSIIGHPTNARADEIADEAIANYHHWRGHLSSDAIRTVINRTILGAHATVVRPTGGVYFVLKHNTEVVGRLQDAVRGIEGTTVHTVPLVDTDDQLEMVRRAFIDESVGELDRLTREMNELSQGGQITSKRFAELTKRVNDVIAKTDEYEKLIGSTAAATDLRLAACQSARKRLFMNVK